MTKIIFGLAIAVLLSSFSISAETYADSTARPPYIVCMTGSGIETDVNCRIPDSLNFESYTYIDDNGIKRVGRARLHNSGSCRYGLCQYYQDSVYLQNAPDNWNFSWTIPNRYLIALGVKSNIIFAYDPEQITAEEADAAILKSKNAGEF